MKKILAALALLLLSTPALAADNAVVATPGSGITFRSKDVGAGVQAPSAILVDQTGTFPGAFTAYGTAPTGNVPGFNAFITNVPAVSQSGVWSVNQTGPWNVGQTGTWTVQPGNTANTTAWLVTGTGGTFPVTQTGSWTVQPGNTANTTPWIVGGNVSNAADAVATGSTSTPNIAYNYGFNGTTWDRLRLDASKNLNVNCAVGCSATTGITSWAGGTLGAMANYGTSPGAVLVPGINAFVTNTNANGQATMANSSPVVIASNQSNLPVTVSNAGQAAASASVPVVLASDQFGDPCFATAKSTASFSSATSGGQIVAGTSAKKTYVCSMTIITSAAANVSLIEGTGASVCTGSPVAVWGNTGTTAANGFPFGATGGVTLGGGNATMAQTATNANNLCLLFTTTNTPTVVATIAYVQK